MKKYLFPLSKRSLAIIFAGIVLNVSGECIAAHYNLPLYMDSVGTFVVSMLLGPFAGALTGIVMNVLVGGAPNYQWLYALVSVGGAFTVGRYFYKKEDYDSFRIITASVITGLVMTVLSTPINVIFNSGMTGNVWGDALSEMLMQYIGVKTICCIAGELIVNIPDKILTLMALTLIIRFFRREGIEIISEEEASGKDDRENKGNGARMKLPVFFLAAVLASALAVRPVMASKLFDLKANSVNTIFGIDEGLSSTEINTIAQSGDGYIWAGAYSGLYRFNGSSFEKADIDPRISNAVSLYTDRKGRLWIGTNDSGVGCYDPNTGNTVFFSTEDGLCSDSIRGICEDDTGTIYVGTASYLCSITGVDTSDADEDTDRSIRKPRIKVYGGFKDITFVSSLTSIDDGSIMGVTGNGVLFIMKRGKISYKYESDVYGEIIYSAACSGNKNFLAGTNGRTLYHLELTDDGFEKVSAVSTNEFNCFNRIIYDRLHGGYLFACTNGFGFIDDDGIMKDLTTDDFDSAASDILTDKQGNIWFSSDKHGILKISLNPFSDLFKRLGETGKVVNAVMPDGDDIYIGTDEGLIKADLNTNSVKKDEVPAILKDARIRHIMKDDNGDIYYSTYGTDGLVKVSPNGSITTYNDSNSEILGSRFRFVTKLKDKRLMAASPEGVSFLKDGRVVKTLGAKDGMDIPKILSCLEEDDGTIYLGTDGDGVYKIQNDRVVSHTGKEEGLASEVVMKIVSCAGGRIYVASNGLYYHEDGKDVRKLENFPFTNDYDIYLSNDNRAFVLSAAGLYIVNGEDLIKDEEDYSYSLLNRKCGLTSTLTANAYYAVEDEKLYLCCTEGVFILNMDDYSDFDSHYQIVLRSVKKGDEEVPFHNGVYEIPSGPGQIVITPAVLNYTISDPLVGIRLEGIDDTTRIMRQSELESIYYSSLPYGRHRLMVQVLDDSGKQVLKEMVFLIYKDSRLYEHTYFKVYLAVNLTMLLVILVWMFSKMGNMAIISRQYEQIREAKEDAEFANQAKSRFLAQMSHEIRTPINAVLGMDEMILRETREPDTRAYAKDIYKAGNTLLSIINDILDSSKIESGRMEIVPVEYEPVSMIRELENMISGRAQEKDLMLEITVDPDLPKVLFGDDVRIRQVITNLLTNAVKYTVTGTIWFRISGTKDLDNLKLHVEVEDTGIGIKEEDLPKLFDAYKRFDEGFNRNVEGTGLGMSITEQLLRMMGSRLEVNSIYGRGTKISFDIDQKIINPAPIGEYSHIKATKEDLSSGPQDDAFTAKDARVLVVDDNPMNRKVIRSLLKPVGIQISEAASGPEALAKVEHEKIDIVFMDHMMPGMDGVETMKRMREMESCRNLPIFALTANAVTGAKEEYMRQGFDGFVSKPTSYDTLSKTLKNALPADLIKPLTEEERKELQEAFSVSSNPVPDDLPFVDGLDWSYAWLHLPDRDMLRDGIESFYDVIGLQAERLEKCYEALVPKAGNRKPAEKPDDGKDSPLDLYRIQVHAMKSTAATVGIVPLAGMAKMLESAAKEKNMKVIHAVHEPFRKEWVSYRDKLKGVFGLGLENTKKKPGNSEWLKDMLRVLSDALEVLDTDRMDGVMFDMREHTFGQEIDELVVKLNAAVMDMDEELANEIIKEIEEKQT
ncbi:MAG: response regulator [Lachnospiraceae bacterium]|nr:response regulator [Lachnospiraceae bacterium]